MSPSAMLFAFLLMTGEPATAAAGENVIMEIDSVLLTLVEEVEVPAREAGALAEIAVREGQIVSSGSLLGRVDDTEAQLALNRAKLEADEARRLAENDVPVRVARKTHEVAEVELKRADETRDRFSKTISQSELDERRLKFEKSALEVEQAEHQFKSAAHVAQVAANELELAKRNVERRRITSPIEGAVVKVYHRTGEWVEPGDTVLRVVRINPLRAEAFVLAREIPAKLVGRDVMLQIESPGQERTEFPGKLVFVSPEVDPFNGQVRVWAEIDNSEQLLRPGLRGKISVLVESNP